MADTGMPKAGDEIADKYRIEQLIGVGGMGAVFSARHLLTGKRVALKWMLPELAKDLDAVHRFLREAHAAGRINHPNVVDVYDVGRHGESYFLVMEFLQGEPLTSALARRDLTPQELLALLLPAMRGVAAAHRRGVVHRDLKPDNIFLAYEEDGVRRDAKVLDFGISKIAAEEHTSNLRLTKTGAVVGTPYYMAPEQIRGSQQLDQRADIYAFGVILYEALTGRVPFEAESYGALVLEVATGTPKTPLELVPTLPAELSQIVLRAMARDMNDRYPTMESLIAVLEPFTQPNGMRGTLQRSLHSATPQDLEATRIESLSASVLSAPPPHGPTRPHLASTPFAAEMRELQGAKQSSRNLLGAAAVLVVGVAAIWYFTREPAVAPGPTVSTSTTQLQGASDLRTQAPPPALEGARTGMVPPVTSAPPATTGALPGAADVAGAQRREPEATPVEAVRSSARGEPVRSNVSRFEPLGERSKSSGRRGHGHAQEGAASLTSKHSAVREPSSKPAADEAASDSQVLRIEPAPKPTHRARSGSLNVNEF